jgi:hypothetical protein
MTDTVRTIHRQLLAAGINRRLLFVAWDDHTLKVSRGLNGALVRYNRTTDLYDVTEYHGCDTRPLAEGVYADNLLDVIMPTFTARAVRASMARWPWAGE